MLRRQKPCSWQFEHSFYPLILAWLWLGFTVMYLICSEWFWAPEPGVRTKRACALARDNCLIALIITFSHYKPLNSMHHSHHRRNSVQCELCRSCDPPAGCAIGTKPPWNSPESGATNRFVWPPMTVNLLGAAEVVSIPGLKLLGGKLILTLIT